MPEPQTKYQTGDISECWASESVPSYENTSIPWKQNGVNTGHLLTVWSTCSPFLSNRNPHCESWEVRRVDQCFHFPPWKLGKFTCVESSYSLLSEGTECGGSDGCRLWGRWEVTATAVRLGLGGSVRRTAATRNTLSVWFRLPLGIPLHFLSAVLHPSPPTL